MRLKTNITICMLCLLNITILPQEDSLRHKIEQIIKPKFSVTGVAIYDLENGDTLTINDKHHFPMQSVYKFHLALAVLRQVDKGKLSLNQMIKIKKSDLHKNTYSPLADKYPDGNVELPLSDILFYSVSKSDNNACDILFRILGGTQKVEDYIHKLGIKDISIKATEEEMHKEWNVQYTNWTTPFAAVNLLAKFYNGEILSKKSFNFLWELMTETTIGRARIKGKLPEGTIVAHKTGLSGTNNKGITAAVNDIGIVTLPNGNHYAIAVFVSDSILGYENMEKIIADISKATWDYFTSK